MKTMETFERNVKMMLQERGMSQAEFSRQLGVGKSTVTNWLKNHYEPTLSNIIKIMQVLSCDFQDLIE